MEYVFYQNGKPNFNYTRNMDIVKRNATSTKFYKGQNELEGRNFTYELDRDRKIADLPLDLSRQQRLLSPPNGTVIRQLERSRRRYITNTSSHYNITDLSTATSEGGYAKIPDHHLKMKQLPNMRSSMMNHTCSLSKQESNYKDSTTVSRLVDGVLHRTQTEADVTRSCTNSDSSNKLDRNAGTMSRNSMRTKQNGSRLKSQQGHKDPPVTSSNAPSKRKPPWHAGNSFPPGRVIHKSARNSNLNSMFPRVDGINWGRSCPTQIYANFRLWQAQQLRANGTIQLEQIWNRRTRALQFYEETPEGYPSTPYGWYSRNSSPTEDRLLEGYSQTTGIM